MVFHGMGVYNAIAHGVDSRLHVSEGGDILNGSAANIQ